MNVNIPDVINGALVGLGIYHILGCWLNYTKYLPFLRKKDEKLTWTCDEPHCVFKVEFKSESTISESTRDTFDSIVRSHIYHHAITPDPKDFV